MSVDLSDDDQGGVRHFVRYGPEVKGWVVEVWFRPPRSSNPERPLYWHGPPTCKTSNLNKSVAVFADSSAARTALEMCGLPLPISVTRWSAVTVEEALTRFSPYPAVHGWVTGRQIPAEGLS